MPRDTGDQVVALLKHTVHTDSCHRVRGEYGLLSFWPKSNVFLKLLGQTCHLLELRKWRPNGSYSRHEFRSLQNLSCQAMLEIGDRVFPNRFAICAFRKVRSGIVSLAPYAQDKVRCGFDMNLVKTKLDDDFSMQYATLTCSKLGITVARSGSKLMVTDVSSLQSASRPGIV